MVKSLVETDYHSTVDEGIPLIITKSNVSTSINSIKSNELIEDNSNPFEDIRVANYYKEIYESCNYECKQYFDPTLSWTSSEEKKLVNKIDKKAALFACIMFIGLQIDRGNLGQAISDNMLEDLNLTTNDYNKANTLYFIMFMIAEIPSQIIGKKLGPDKWVPIQMISWSIVASSQALIKGKFGFFMARALTALFSGGFIPTIILWLSYFYKSEELPIRLSWFWTTLSIVQISMSLFAFGILRLRGLFNWEGWRWLFIIEGSITFIIAIFSLDMMVPSLVDTKSRLSPNGWLNEKEMGIAVNRILRNDPSKGDMNNRQAIKLKELLNAISDYDLWPVYLIGLIAYIPVNTITNYFTITLKNLGWSTLTVNLLTIPYNFFHIIFLLQITFLSEKLNDRCLVSLLVPIWTIPLTAILNWWSGSMIDTWGTWAILNLILGAPYIHAICVSWVSRNSGNIHKRSISAAMYNMCVQTGSVIAANIYKADDAPQYRRGNNRIFWLSFSLFPILIATRIYYQWRNSFKKKTWSNMTSDEKLTYLTTTSDEGNKKLNFAFAY